MGLTDTVTPAVESFLLMTEPSISKWLEMRKRTKNHNSYFKVIQNQTSYEQIVFDKNSIPCIKETTMKVVELVLDKLAYGWSPEELQLNFPHISLAQILSALAYYEDHKEQLDQDIERRMEDVHTLEREDAARGPSLVKRRLKKKGFLKCRFRFIWTSTYLELSQ